jgi:phage gpG-like protein
MKLSIDIAGDIQIERDLMRLGDNLKNAKAGFRLLVDDLLEIERKQFESEGRRSSGGWAPLAESTLQQKMASGEENKILVDTGALRDSLTKRGNPGQLLKITNLEFRFGSKVPYMVFHQLGTVNMPQRRPLELTREDRRHLVKVLQRHFLGQRHG